MTVRGGMKRWMVPVVLAVTLLGAACSDGLSGAQRVDGASRSAAGATGASDVSPDLDEFCSTFTRAEFLTAPPLATCFILENKTSKFTAPNKLGSRVALTVPKAECGVKSKVSGDPCVATKGKYGEIRDHQNGSVYGPRILTPNPFRDIGAIQFQAAAMWAGTEEMVYVGSSESPFELTQSPAKAFFSNPYSADTGGYCAAQGQFFGCSLVDGSWARNGDWQRPRYIFDNRPLRIVVSNNTPYPLSLEAEPTTSRTVLLDPIARGGLATIPKGGEGYDGGYRATNSDQDQTYSAQFCLNWKGNYLGSIEEKCIRVVINIVLKKVDGRWVSNMNDQANKPCAVQVVAQTYTPKCNVVVNDSEVDRFVSISVVPF